MSISLSSSNSSKQVDRAGIASIITKSSSKQTYYTIRFLVDKDRVEDAFRAYAYFRWVDDQLDCGFGTSEEKNLFLHRQQSLLDACYRGEIVTPSGLEEQMLIDLVSHDREKSSGLHIYLYSMMSVMAFDVERCGKQISRAELSNYSDMLSKAVTEAMFFFIGHQNSSPFHAKRYHAVIGAHIVHMLRDLVKDFSVGYINIPAEDINIDHKSIMNTNDITVRNWVYERVKVARVYISAGRQYISKVKNFRCRLAGFAYAARFEWMVKIIEQDNYYLRQNYPERKSFQAGLWILWRVLNSIFSVRWINLEANQQNNVIDRCEE